MKAAVTSLAPGRAASFDGTPRVRTNTWPALTFVALATIVLCLPFLRTIFSLGDEGVLLHGAVRMLQGDRLYVDFFEFLPPGGFILTELWLRIAGLSVLAERSLAITTIVAIACFTFLACRRACGNAPLSVFLAVGWVMLSQGFWTQLSHHWLTTMFCMAGAWAALVFAQDASRRRRWAVLGGAVFGMASMVTPNCGILAMLAGLSVFFPLRQHRVALLAYIIAGALVPLCMLFYLAWCHALIPAFNDVVRFTASQYAPIEAMPYGHWAGPVNAPLIYVFPLAFVLALVVYLRSVVRDRVVMPCVAFALAGFISSFPRADVFHIAFEVPLACPLLACGTIRLALAWPRAYRVATSTVIGAMLLPSVFGYALSVRDVSRAAVTPTPRGGMAFFLMPGSAQMLTRIAAMPQGDQWFFYPFMPMMSFLTARDDVAKYDVLTPGYSLPSQYRDTCRSVLRDADWVVIDRHWTDPAALKHNFPALRDPQPPETRAFEQVLDDNFALVAQDGTFELRHRKDNVSDAACTAVAK